MNGMPLGETVGKLLVFWVAALFCDFTAHAQSVAETLKTLTSQVANLEVKAGSPLVQTRNGPQGGGQLYVAATLNQVGVFLRADAAGGNANLYSSAGQPTSIIGTSSDQRGMIALYNSTGQIVSRLGSAASTPYLYLYDPSGQNRRVQLSADGLRVFDTTGTNQVASFISTDDGTAGQVLVNGTKVHDYAEIFEIAEGRGLLPGSVVAASADGKGIKLSGGEYDLAVVGVISGAGQLQAGMQIGSREDGSSDLPVAVSGQVYVRVSAEAGAVAVGDLLVSSSIAGVAMRGADKARLTGTVVGKALQPYSRQGESLIRMLVMVR